MRLQPIFNLAACFALCAGAASAQDRAARFVERDRNGDGVLSRDEYTSTGGHPGNFRALDTNNDGVLSRGEFVDRGAGVEDGSVPAVQAEAARDPNVLTKVEFDKIDVNRDNVLTKTEWSGDLSTFRKLDINNDGYVSSSEYVAAAPLVGAIGGLGSGSAENQFLVKDRNRDGLLTRAEYGDPLTFDRVDRNDDRRISYDEFVNPPPPSTHQERFDSLDRNRDGVVSRGEWKSEAGVFHLADRNGDGVVTMREYLRAPAGQTYELRFEQIDLDNDGVIERREWPAGEAVTFDRADRNDDGAVTRWEFANAASAPAAPVELSFEEMDHNDDGVISRYEWHADRAAFDLMDRNRDGIVTYREFQSPLPADTRRGRFQELDRNRDRLISRAEWLSDRESFAILDRNRDRMLTASEYHDTRGLQERFVRLDDNGDGTLDRREWGGAAATFRVLDRNRDGRVTPDEFMG
jgi:Ca2+-binding EF-hand superfamily protein